MYWGEGRKGGLGGEREGGGEGGRGRKGEGEGGREGGRKGGREGGRKGGEREAGGEKDEEKGRGSCPIVTLGSNLFTVISILMKISVSTVRHKSTQSDRSYHFYQIMI